MPTTKNIERQMISVGDPISQKKATSGFTWDRNYYVGDMSIGHQHNNLPECDVGDRFVLLETWNASCWHKMHVGAIICTNELCWTLIMQIVVSQIIPSNCPAYLLVWKYFLYLYGIIHAKIPFGKWEFQEYWIMLIESI